MRKSLDLDQVISATQVSTVSVEEPCAEKSACTVLKTSKRGDSLA